LTETPTLRRSVASGGVYAVAAAGQRALTFLLLPIYTRVLSPAEYGRVALLASISALVYVVLGTGFDFALIRQYYHYDSASDARLRFVSSAWLFQMLAAPGIGLVAALGVLLFAPSSSVFRPDEVAIAIITTAVLVVATTVPLTVLRAQQRLKPYVVLTAVSGVANAAFTVIFVVGLRWGVIGWLLGTLCANALALLVALFVIQWSPRQARDYRMVRQTLAVGLPLVPASMAALSLQVGDRILLSGLVAAAALGVYSLGATLALPAVIVIQSLNQGFMPAYARLQHRPDDTAELRASITVQVVMAAWVGVALSLAGPSLVTIVAPPSYGAAGTVIPWITLGYIFYGLFVIPLNGVTFVLGRTKFVWIITLGAATVNVASICILVGPYGIDGAAAGVAIGYCVQFIAMSAYARHAGVRFSFDWPVLLRICTLASTVYVLGVTLTPTNGIESLVTRSALVLALSGGLAVASGIATQRVGVWARAIRGGKIPH
jgi:O-antigen/teichoic acid export membrane protein